MEAQLNGVRIAYDDIGKGVPVVWVHGYPLNRSLWAPQAGALADCARNIIPDLRGWGASEAPSGVYTMEVYASDLRALLDELGLDRAVLAGLSMGGYVALAFLRNYPERLRGLILIATRAAPDTLQVAEGRRANAERALQEGVGSIVEPMVERVLSPATLAGQPGLVRAVRTMVLASRPRGVAGALLGMAERPDSRPQLPAIGVPALVVGGADDTIVPPDELRQMAEQIPGARAVLLPKAGHLVSLEQPDAFNREVRAFLGALDARAG